MKKLAFLLFIFLSLNVFSQEESFIGIYKEIWGNRYLSNNSYEFSDMSGNVIYFYATKKEVISMLSSGYGDAKNIGGKFFINYQTFNEGDEYDGEWIEEKTNIIMSIKLLEKPEEEAVVEEAYEEAVVDDAIVEEAYESAIEEEAYESAVAETEFIVFTDNRGNKISFDRTDNGFDSENKLLLKLNENEYTVFNGIISAIEPISKTDYSNYNIPNNAILAAYTWQAGFGNIFYIEHTGTKLYIWHADWGEEYTTEDIKFSKDSYINVP